MIFDPSEWMNSQTTKKSKKQTTKKPKPEPKSELKRRIMDIATEFYQQFLWTQKEALLYLKGRAIKKKSAMDFRIGYADEKANSLMAHLLTMGYTEQELLESRVFTTWRDTNKIIPLFRDKRIVLPLLDREGNTIAITTRSIDQHAETRYLHTKGGLKTPFNAWNIPEQVGTLYVVEGQFDAIALIQLGYGSVLGLMGGKHSHDKYKDYFRRAKEIVIAFDNDENGEGQKAADKLAFSITEDEGMGHIDVGQCELPLEEDCSQMYAEGNHHELATVLESPKLFRGSDRHKEMVAQKVSHKTTLSEEQKIDNCSTLSVVRALTEQTGTERADGTVSFMCPLPRHQESTPSFVVYPETDSFYCFGCGKAGNAVAFLAFYRGISFRESRRWLQEGVFNGKVPEGTPPR